MFLQQKPIPGYWYSNLSGQLNGKRETVDLQSWHGMDLVLHSPVALDSHDGAARDL
jgi:hypothetical protein